MAVIRRLPRWGYTWAASGVMALFLPGTLLSDDMPFDYAHDTPMTIGRALIGLALLALGFMLFWAATRLAAAAGRVGIGYWALGSEPSTDSIPRPITTSV